MKIDCLIITALSKELDAVRFQFRHWSEMSHPDTTAALYETTSANGLRVVAALGSTMGHLAASAMTSQLIQALAPSTVMLVGIAGGMDREISLGDVVAADQIVSYELGKVTSEGFGPRWSVFRTDAALLARLNGWANQTWQDYIRTRPPEPRRPRLHTGVYLSGDKVIADAATAGALKSVWRKAAAIDMEAAAVAAAVYHSPRHPSLVVIKAVCDYADAQKNDDWHDFAAESAASCALSFVLEHLQSADLPIAAPSGTRGTDEKGTSADARGIRLILAKSFDLAELKTLCFDLEIDWDEIAGDRKSEKIVELLRFVERRKLFSRLIDLVNRDRDGILRAYVEPSDA